MKRQQGFTLLELLIALAIFAILSALAYGGLRSVLTSREQTEKQAQRLTALQTTMSFITRDLAQAIDRPVRDEYGGLKPPIQGGTGSLFLLELTREGFRNPANQVRSALQRVAYVVSDETLVRHSWRVLDRAQDSTPFETKLLTGVRGLTVRFLTPGRQWVTDWPPPASVTGAPPMGMPLAVEVVMDLADMGTVGRIFRIPGGS